MSIPNAVGKTNVDDGASDTPAAGRQDIENIIDEFNALRTHLLGSAITSTPLGVGAGLLAASNNLAVNVGTGIGQIVQLENVGGSAGLPTVDGSQLTGISVPDVFTERFLHVRDEKAASTPGGTFTAGAYRTRTLNTVKTNLITGASLASNQITLPAGTYYCEFAAEAFQCNVHKAKIQDITNNTALIIGRSGVTTALADAGDTASGSGRFTLAGEAKIELQHQCAVTKATAGLGAPSNFGDTEVYAEVKIWKTE